jgi:tetratricopeptide (TPR) repeat protein
MSSFKLLLSLMLYYYNKRDHGKRLFMKKSFSMVLLCVLTAVWGFGQDSFARGEELFMRNKPQEASVYLLNAINETPGNVKAFLYLGIAYEQTGRIDEATAVYREVLYRAGDLTANVANNLGNLYFKKGNFADAERAYTQSLEADRSYAQAWLGRANTRLKQGSLQNAVSDYEQYLRAEPRSSQRASVERLIAYIRAEAVEAERRRLAAEEAARAEAERRQRLLDEVSASLTGAAGSSQGLSSGAENVEGYDGEFELE